MIFADPIKTGHLNGTLPHSGNFRNLVENRDDIQEPSILCRAANSDIKSETDTGS